MAEDIRTLDDFNLIPRDLIFGNPERAAVKVSPDGSTLSWLAPSNGVLNIWIAPIDDFESSRVVTSDTARGIRDYLWSYREGTLLYRQDFGGDENFHVFAVDVAAGTTTDLTPFDKVAAVVDALSPWHPDQVMLGINDRDSSWHDIYRVDLATGERNLVELNTERIADYMVDGDLQVTHAVRSTESGGSEYLRRQGDGGWVQFDEVDFEDSVSIPLFGPSLDGSTLYMTDARGRNTAALFAIDTNTYQSTLLFEDGRADIARVSVEPTTRRVDLVAVNYLNLEWHSVGETGHGEDLALLAASIDGDLAIESRTLDDRTWIVSGSASDAPVTYFRFDRERSEVIRLFSVRPRLEAEPLVRRHPVLIGSRDDFELVSYLALPPHVDFKDGSASESSPMVLLVHGGPWSRDSYGYDPTVQWLANRGYATLQVNYRGSTGFGKEFLNAGNGEWAGRMHDDLIDAVQWAVDSGVATPSQIGIMGGSYGGYATLVGLTFTPEVFACGVDIVGPANLHTLLATVPPYWASFYRMLVQRMGDPETEEGRIWLTERSPLSRVEAIAKPLLIGQGANDPRVKQDESDQIVTAMTDRGIPVTYLLFPDEGHGFARPENAKAMNAIAEGFLGEWLGGRVEEIGSDLEGSSVQVPVGASLIAGLVEQVGSRSDA